MEESHYLLARGIQDKINKNPGRFVPAIREKIDKICTFKKKPIMSWYLFYLAGVCKTQDIHDMDNYAPPDTIAGIKAIYPLDTREAVAFVSSIDHAYYNQYDLPEESLVKGILESRRGVGKPDPVSLVMYEKTIWFVEPKPENQENS